ncbi:MAG: type II toxin-antitoxin system VapC family toxin [Gammaproteobacteria bacterium]|nr:type II toxin-antitoxin system VapC family toxin [Gammaproteobacteria bacterium]MDE0441226.1 type II toxin-antitoxin system VapC family toxin [Gammaproteobacteria bacterium]
MKILLDSNAYSLWKRGQAHVAELIRSSGEVLMPIVVVGELLYGFRYGSRGEDNVRELHLFLGNSRVDVVATTMTTADRYARIASALRAKGRPIPTNDIWIAAHAMETGADLVSSDQHFAVVDGLAWIPIRRVGSSIGD